MRSWKMRRYRHLKFLAVFVAFTMVLTLGFASKSVNAATGLSGFATMEGYNVDSKDWEGAYVTGNLGKTYAEGEWFPGRIRLNGFQSVYPNFVGFPDISIWYDAAYATNSGTGMFVDLVKGIQIGVRTLSDNEGWPMSNGLPYPLGSAENVDDAQNHSGENAWVGYKLLKLPNSQMNRSAETATLGGQGSITDGKRMFTVTAEDIKSALNSMGIGLNTNNIEIYFEFHLARTSIWGSRNLQTEYASGAPASWGGYLYGLMNFNAIAFGSGPKTGSSGHFGLLDSSKTVPLPDTPEVYRTVTGMKFLDVNNNGQFDVGEPGLKDWTINLVGYIEDIEVTLTTKTGPDGIYTFGGLSYGSELRVHEVMEPGYTQTYPHSEITLTNGAKSFMKVETGKGPWRWYIDRSLMPDNANDAVTISGIDFGNFLPNPKIEVKKTGDELSKIGDEIEFTVEVKNTGNVDLELTSIVDDKFGDLSYIKWGTEGFGATLAKGATESHTFKMVIPKEASDPFVNKVTAVYNYMQIDAKGESSHSTNLFQPNSSIVKKVDRATAIPGETVKFSILVENLSSEDSPIQHYVLTDELLGWTVAGGTAKEFDLMPGATKSFLDIPYIVPMDASTKITNVAAIDTSFADFPNKYNYQANVSVDVLKPGLTITKTGDALSKLGDMTNYTFLVKNTGEVPLSLKSVVDDPFGDITANFLKPMLNPGDTEEVKLSFAIPMDAQNPFINKVKAIYTYKSSDYSADFSADGSWSVDLFKPSSTIDKTVNKPTAIPGETVKFTIKVTNTSTANSPVQHYVLTDELLGLTGIDAVKFDLAPEGIWSKTYDYVIPMDASGTITNIAVINTSFTDFPNKFEYSDDASVIVLKPALKITKTGDALSKLGDMTSFTFLVENIGETPLNLKSVVDIPFGDITAKFLKTTLNPGEQEEVKLSFAIPSEAPDPFVNKVKATYTYKSSDFSADFSADGSWSVDLFQPSSTIDKTVNKPTAIPGETVTFKIMVKNTSSLDSPTQHYVLTDELLGLTGGAAIEFDLASDGEWSKTFDYVIPADASGTVKNIAVINTSFKDFPNKFEYMDDAEVKVLKVGLEIVKTGDALSKIGDMTKFKFVVTNTGEVPLDKVSIVDNPFGDITSSFIKATLQPGESETVELEFKIPDASPDPFINKVKAIYKYIDAGTFSKDFSADGLWEVNLFQPGIDIEKTADKTVSMVGDTVKYKIIVTNTSSPDSPDLKYSVVDDVYGTVVTDALLSPGGSKAYTYDYLIKNTDPNPLVNTAKVTASPVGFPNVLEDKDSHEVKLFTPGLTIKKTADTEISKVGDTINYKIVVKNTTAEAYAPKIHCVLTDALLGLNMSFDLASGEEKIVNVPYVVKASDDPDYLTKFGWTELKNTAKVVGSPIGFEGISEFKLEDSVTVDLVHPHIDIDKSVNTAFAHVGDTVTYTIKITNTGDIALHNIVVKDSMLGTLSAFATSLAVGAHDTHTYDRLLTIADIGILTNTATVTSNPVGLPNKIEDKDDAVVEVKPRLYDETGWAYGGSYAKPIKDIEGVTSTNWGWTNGPIEEGDYRWPIYVGAGQNDLSKGKIVGELIIAFHDGTMKITYKMDEGFSLKEVHLYVGKDPLPTKERGKTTVVVDSPGLFPINPKDVDGKTEWSITIDKLKAPVYVAAHCVVWVPWQEMNKIYNATTY